MFHCFPADYRVLGLVVKASASRAADLGSISAFTVDLSPGRVTAMTGKLVLQLLPYQAPGIKRAALGLVGLVSVYYDLMIESLICNFHLRVGTRATVLADLSMKYASMLLVR